MWIFTTHGFFSAVCARQGDGTYGLPPGTEKIMVRARCRDHLVRLGSAYPEQLGTLAITESADTDYRYRVFVDKPVWRQVMAALVDDIGYDNFKNVAARVHGHGSAYVHALHEVWEIGYRMQAAESQTSKG
jgi:hypothetical protein